MTVKMINTADKILMEIFNERLLTDLKRIRLRVQELNSLKAT
jgi:hypothetical protein